MAGCNDYVTKPFNRIELLARVRVQLAMQKCCYSMAPALSKRPAGPAPAPVKLTLTKPTQTNGDLPRTTEVFELTPPQTPKGTASDASYRLNSAKHSRGGSEQAALADVLKTRLLNLRKEVSVLRSELRAEQKSNMSMRAELVATKAGAEHTWETLLDVEDKLRQEEERSETALDQLIEHGVPSRRVDFLTTSTSGR